MLQQNPEQGLDGAAENEMWRGNAFDAAVGVADHYACHAVCGASLDAKHWTVRANDAAAGRQGGRYKGNIGAALIAARTTIVATAAVIARRASIPDLRKCGAAVGLPIKAERRRTAPQGAGCVGEGMRGQRKFARPPARSLAFRTGYTDKFFGLSVERLQSGMRSGSGRFSAHCAVTKYRDPGRVLLCMGLFSRFWVQALTA